MAPKRKRTVATAAAAKGPAEPLINPQVNPEIIDAPNALRASPDSDVEKGVAPGKVKDEVGSESPLSEVPEVVIEPPKKKRNTASKPSAEKDAAPVKVEESGTTPKAVAAKKKTPVKAERNEPADPEAEIEEEEADEDEIKAASMRPPPVHSDYLPLPWKGRLGYV